MPQNPTRQVHAVLGGQSCQADQSNKEHLSEFVDEI
jgi:hypothetical protein